MASYFDYMVPLPTGKNLSRRRIGNGNSVYIYYTYQRVKSKGGNLMPLANTIGKLVPDSNPPMMYPNLNYYKYFAETSPTAVTNMNHRDNVVLGPYVLFNKILSDYHLDQIAYSVIPDSATAELVLDAAAYELVNEASAKKFFPEYATGYMSFTAGMKIFSDATTAKFIRTLGDEIKNKFISLWAKSLEKSKNAVIFTGTTITSPNRVERPVSYAIAYDAELCLPVYYDACYGGEPDLSEVIENVYALGYGNLENVVDGTSMPRRDIFKYLTSTVNPLVMIRGVRKPTTEFRLMGRGKFEGKEQFRIPGTDLFARTEQVRFYPDEPETYYFHVIYDERDANRQKKVIGQTVDQYMNELDQLIGTAREDEVDDKYSAFFNLEYATQPETGGAALLSKAERNIPAIQRALDDAGYLTAISPTMSSAEEAYKRISVQDMTEKLFIWDKPFLGTSHAQGSTAEHTAPSNNGRFFVDFLASIMRCAIYRELRKRDHDINSKLYGFSVDDVVKELESVVATLRPDEKYSLRTGESALVPEILDMFSLTADDITNAIAKLNHELDLPPKAKEKSVPEATLDTRLDRICSALDLLNESYRFLAKDYEESGLDVADIDQQIKAHIHPNWLR